MDVAGTSKRRLLFVSCCGWLDLVRGMVPGPEARYPLAFVPIPWLVWAAIRFAARGRRLLLLWSLTRRCVQMLGHDYGVGPVSSSEAAVNGTSLCAVAVPSWARLTVTSLTMARGRR